MTKITARIEKDLKVCPLCGCITRQWFNSQVLSSIDCTNQNCDFTIKADAIDSYLKQKEA